MYLTENIPYHPYGRKIKAFLKHDIPGGGEEQVLEHLEVTVAVADTAVGAMDDEQLVVDSLR